MDSDPQQFRHLQAATGADFWGAISATALIMTHRNGLRGGSTHRTSLTVIFYKFLIFVVSDNKTRTQIQGAYDRKTVHVVCMRFVLFHSLIVNTTAVEFWQKISELYVPPDNFSGFQILQNSISTFLNAFGAGAWLSDLHP